VALELVAGLVRFQQRLLSDVRRIDFPLQTDIELNLSEQTQVGTKALQGQVGMTSGHNQDHFPIS
jgi:hypothetical protein